MLQTKFKYENKQRAITQKLSKQGLRNTKTALPLNETYPPTKFHDRSRYSFGDMLRTKKWTPPPPTPRHPPATADPIIRPIFEGHIKG